MSLRRRGERGLSESIQLALIWPVLMLVTLGLIQAGLWVHGRNVVERAAAAAVDSARGSYGSPGPAEELAADIARSGGLDRVVVRVTRGATEVSATVTADAPALLDLGLAELRETASAPLEQVTPP